MTMEHVTTGTAAGAVTSPIWLPWLHAVSDVAALTVPILGAIWLIVQISVKLYEAKKQRQ